MKQLLKNDAKRAKSTYHSTAEQAAKIAKEAEVSQLLIGHFSARFHDLSAHLSEAQSVFPKTELAEDGKVFFHIAFLIRFQSEKWRLSFSILQTYLIGVRKDLS